MTSDWKTRIICDADLHQGKPCIRGTRIPVFILVANLAEMSVEQLLVEYPQLVRENIQAALLYAAETSHNTLVT